MAVHFEISATHAGGVLTWDRTVRTLAHAERLAATAAGRGYDVIVKRVEPRDDSLTYRVVLERDAVVLPPWGRLTTNGGA